MSTNAGHPSLVVRMRALAELPEYAGRKEDLLMHAAKLEQAIDASANAIGPEDSALHVAKRLLGAWARARRVLCECTGEPLI